MPGKDDLNALVDEIGGGAKPAEPAPTPTEPSTPEPTKEPEPTPTEPTAAPQATEPEPPKKEPEPAKAPEPKKPDENAKFAQMRVEKAKLEKAIKVAAEAEGLSVDEYLAKIETGALEKRAKDMNVPPEILRRLEETEAKLRLSEQERVQSHLANQFTKVQQAFKLSDAELDKFITTLGDQGFNFQNPLADYETLYRGMYHEQLLEKARQEWIAHSQRGEQSSKTITSNGKPSGGGARKVETEADLNDLLAEFASK